MKKFLALSLSDVVFIMLINVKMPTIVFNIYEQDKGLSSRRGKISPVKSYFRNV